MAIPKKRILGVYAPPPRPTLWAAGLVAVLLSLPVGLALTVLEWLW
ncbi:hypothetical protein [Roseovarius bejariae]|nr:hypothetical protein [Roseovarius bejariae]